MREQNEIEIRRIEQLLAHFWRQIPTLSDRDVRDMARSAPSGRRRTGDSMDGSAFRRTRWRLRVRWSAVAAAGALLVGSGLGFGLGSSVTPSGSAGTTFAGFGFIPQRGWTVVQSGTATATATQGARAIAANVPLHPSDDLRGTPVRTLESLPRAGILIHAIFTTRGDAEEDFKFDVRQLPLQIADAKRLSATVSRSALGPRRAQFRLRAGVGGYNVEADIHFGTTPPTAAMIAAVQRQLNRLVVGSERVTIFARPTTLPGRAAVDLFGSVANGKAGEDVVIEAKDCGSTFFRVVDGAVTREGGGWSTDFIPAITTTFRAVWNETASAQITVRQRIPVFLRKQLHGRGFIVGVDGKKSFWRKRVLIQRFVRRLGTWSTVKSVVLSESGIGDPSLGTRSTKAEFNANVPKGTLLRAVFPLSQARPCYLAGVSRLLRT